MSKNQLQANALSKARTWTHPPMIKRYIIEATKIKPLTELQWWRLQIVHGAELITAVRAIVEKVVRS